MKKYISVKLLIISILILCLGACEDFLDRNPLDQISSETFWNKKSDTDMALAACYASLQAGSLWAMTIPNWDAITDNAWGQHNYDGSRNIVGGDVSPTTGGYISNVYYRCYAAIARIHILLENMKDIPELTENEKNLYEAEARFLRAFYYYQLYFAYGDVPLVLKALTIDEQKQPKNPASEILAQILADLDFAIQNLNNVTYSDNSGHATVSTAQAFKARVLMFTGYDSNGDPVLGTLTKARDLALTIMGSGYSLSPNFEDLFQTAGQSGNPELIFTVNYLPPDNYARWDQYYGDWLVSSPLQNFVDAFQCSDGLAWGVSPLTDVNNPFNDRDPRLRKTVFVDYPDWGGGNEHHPSNSRPTGYGLLKFLDPNNTPYNYSTLSGQNAVVLRLGEVLLMYAEAQNEIAGPDQTVYDAVNAIRARVNMPSLPAGLSQAEMLDAIKYERRIELAFEGSRFYDLKRWRIADILNNVTDAPLAYVWEHRYYLWPLPQDEIDGSEGILIQNPDYQ